MPNLVSMDLSAAQSALAAAGVTPKVSYVLSDTSADGTVLAQKPAAGRPMTSGVELTAAQEAVATYLSDETPIEGEPDTEVTEMDGQEYPHSFALGAGRPGSFGWSDEEVAVYDLGRHYTRLYGRVGLSDRSHSDGFARLQILTETGRKILDERLKVGKYVTLKDVDVTNVLRLRFVATPIPENEYQISDVLLADMKVLGDPAEVPTPSESPDPFEDTQ